MSTTQNASTMSSICNTREPLWAEDFIDLSEFCQPSTIPTKMEDLADEHVTSPISSTVHDHGFDYSLEVNDGLDNTIEDTFWCMGSPIDAMQEELCDPISDWLLVTSKETNNNSNTNNNNIGILNDNPCSRSQIYNISDTLLNSTFTSSVPKIALAPTVGVTSAALPTAYDQHHHQRKDHHVNLLSSPPLQPDTTFFDSILSVSNAPSSNDTLPPQSLYQKSTRTNASAALFATEKIPDTTFTNAFRSSHQNIVTVPPQSSSSPPLIAEDSRASIAPVLNRVTADTSVSSPCSVQSPSITQSNLNTNLDSAEKQTASGIINRRNVKLKLKMEETPRTSCSLNTPEMLQPLVTKNSEFDLVSFVFDENKPSLSFDVTSLHNNSSSSSNTVATKDTISAISGAGAKTTFATTTVVVPKTSPINIKIEPKEEQIEESQQQSKTTKRIGVKRVYETDDSYDFETSSKHSRRFSNVSQLDSDDLTQLESEKYRELRNRNNEASRRSRANRKSREVEMRDHASKLESENRRLKVKAEEMEKLVKRLRNCLMQLVLKRR